MLEHFVEAQDPVYAEVTAELREGRKRTHWMWFVFPQIEGLGRSFMALRFALRSKEEARAYLDHPVLGPRLKECTELVNRVEGKTVEEIFGAPDYVKFRSSMTLFAAVAGPAKPMFQQALDKYYEGSPDPLTLKRILS